MWCQSLGSHFTVGKSLVMQLITSTLTAYVKVDSKRGLTTIEVEWVAVPTGEADNPVTGVEFGVSFNLSLLAAASVIKLTEDPLSRNARHGKSSPLDEVTRTAAVASRAA